MGKIVLADGKKAKLLDQQRAYLNTLRYRLFTAVAGGVITGATALGDFTQVADTGYAPVTPVFTAATLNAGNQAQLVAPAITWVFTYSGATPFTILGYYVEDPADNTLVYSQFGSIGILINAAGQPYSVVPQMLDDTMP